MERFIITICRHNFKVISKSINDFDLVKNFAKKYATYDKVWDHQLKRKILTLKTLYSVRYDLTKTHGFHINCLDDFIIFLSNNNISSSYIKIIKKEKEITPSLHNLKIREGFSLRPGQGNIVDFLTTNDKIKCLPAQMGVGKTLLSLYSGYLKGFRFLIIMSARYLDIWLKEIYKGKGTKEGLFINGQEETIVIQGKNTFIKTIKLAQENNLNKSIIIITIGTLSDYLKEFEQNNVSTYGCNPDSLYDLLKINTIYCDEVHELMHCHFRHAINCYFNEIVYLSATITSNDPNTNKLYNLIYPINTRYDGLSISKYINVTAIGYNFNNPDKIRHEGSRGYSHALLEESIMKNKKMLLNYLNMIVEIIKKIFVNNYQENQKMIVFMYTVQLCSITAEYIRQELPQFTCADYTAKHDIEVLYSYDIVITTPGSAGTGKDIEGLVVVLNTIMVRKYEKNSQMLGRLRPVDNLFKGVEPCYYYIVAINLKKHMDLHGRMMHTFNKWAKNIKVANSGFYI